jgi:aminopeptidase N
LLQLVVRQQQTKDPDSQYPQVTLFQTPVEIEIGTASKTSIERVRIEPQKEQTFSFKLDSEPLLVNFDYKGTLIKEMEFKKSTAELAYQLDKDQDVLGRVWALGQLSAQWKTQASSEAKDAIANELAKAVTSDKFWGVRIEAATALADVTGQTGRNALIAATRDSNARVRARAVTSLGRTNDASLASLYKDLLNDQSYAVIKAAALALGQTKSPNAFDVLAGLLKTASWRDNIRVSALAGLGALGDKKATDLAAKYVGQGNLPIVRAAAIKAIGTVGKSDPSAFAIVSRTLEEAVRTESSQLVSASGEALVNVGDPRGLEVLERLTKDVTNAQYVAVLAQFQERLRKGVSGVDKGRTAN